LQHKYTLIATQAYGKPLYVMAWGNKRKQYSKQLAHRLLLKCDMKCSGNEIFIWNLL